MGRVERRIRKIEIEEWFCGCPRHHHQTEDVAVRCMDAQEERERLDVERRRRNLEILLAYAQGDKISSVALKFSLSRAQIHKIVRLFNKESHCPRGMLDKECAAIRDRWIRR